MLQVFGPRDSKVYQMAFRASLAPLPRVRALPLEEKWRLSDPIRRAEAAELQVRLQFAAVKQ
jgi:hypothetical protein